VLLLARSRDPDSPTTNRHLADRYRAINKPSDALGPALRAHSAFVSYGRHKRLSTLWEWKFVLSTALRTLRDLDRRPEARAVYRELRSVFREESDVYRRETPWLEVTPSQRDQPEPRR